VRKARLTRTPVNGIALQMEMARTTTRDAAMHTVESGKRAKTATVPRSQDHEGRREKMLRWSFWTLFLLATLCTLVWKLVTRA
jgi:hypothetical protein